MVKRILVLTVFIAMVQLVNAQLNVSYISNIGYNEDLSDIWGYVAPDGTEYALVGAANGTSIVSLADPENPIEVAYIPGANSIWRDIKTWDTFAYVTTDQGSDGLTVIDMTDLPNSVSSFQMTNFGSLGVLERCHNIWMDEFGFAYLAGCNLNQGGIIYLDCASNPAMPTVAGSGPNTYAHDVFTRDNKMYSSEINDGVFSIYDVSDKSNTQFLGNQGTDFSFTHNAWLNDAGDVLFTTDELANAPVGSYDVSDPEDIKTLDLFKPLTTLGAGVIPHNVHVWEDWIIISYYTDGCIIVDGSNPENLIEVGNFDTFIPASTGFSGAWGAYPFLPSGLILISDIGNGLYVLEPNYLRACWLEGQVTDAVTGAAINNVIVDIQSTELNEELSNAFGEYKTGLATAGTFDVIYSAFGYISDTITLDFENGLLIEEDVQLVPLTPFVLNGTVVDAGTGEVIPDANVYLRNTEFLNESLANYELTTDANGMFSVAEFYQGDYEIFTSKWGFILDAYSVAIDLQNEIVIELDRGYRDDFYIFDLGWTVSGNAASGDWELAEPIGTFGGGGQIFNPNIDVPNDLGTECYVTGNEPGNSVGSNDVDDGNTILTSPVMDLTGLTNVSISFYAWFANAGGNGTPNDALVARLNVAGGSLELITIAQGTNGWEGPYIFSVPDSILTDNMTVEFETADGANSGHLVEAGIDLFEVTGDLVMVSNTNINQEFKLTAMPNPFSSSVNIQYDLPEGIKNSRLVIYNALGQVVSTKSLTDKVGNIIIEELIFRGLYLAQIEGDGFVSAPIKLMKTE